MVRPTRSLRRARSRQSHVARSSTRAGTAWHGKASVTGSPLPTRTRCRPAPRRRRRLPHPRPRQAPPRARRWRPVHAAHLAAWPQGCPPAGCAHGGRWRVGGVGEWAGAGGGRALQLLGVQRQPWARQRSAQRDTCAQPVHRAGARGQAGLGWLMRRVPPPPLPPSSDPPRRTPCGAGRHAPGEGTPTSAPERAAPRLEVLHVEALAQRRGAAAFARQRRLQPAPGRRGAHGRCRGCARAACAGRAGTERAAAAACMRPK